MGSTWPGYLLVGSSALLYVVLAEAGLPAVPSRGDLVSSFQSSMYLGD